jgi:hypothetical protein
MSDAKHTPGPWQLTGWYIRPKCYEGIPTPDSWPAICSVRPWGKDRWPYLHEEETRANIQLIAAAPDLLAALKEIIEHPAAFSDGANRLWSQATAAIAKAEGK